MLQKNYRSLILTYTNENVSNIVNELTKQGKYDDSKIKIMTFDSFKYRYILKAYEPLIIGAYSHTELCDKITIKAPPKQWVNGRYNPLYVKKDKIGHYKSKFGYYCVKFSELIIESDKKTPFLTTAIKKYKRASWRNLHRWISRLCRLWFWINYETIWTIQDMYICWRLLPAFC